jgi:phosphoenolpyruvate carboxykinase (ATP)
MTVANYLLPQRDILPIFSSAAISKSRDETALFVGAADRLDPILNARPIFVNDDVHVWGANGVFRLEGGRYCDIASLREAEASGFNPFLHRFGTLVENVPINRHTGEFEFNRWNNAIGGHVTLPADSLSNVEVSGCAPHPSNIFILVADEFGVLPPISKLTIDQTIYYFLSGPQTSFTPCFAPAGVPLHPKIYADLLRDHLQKWKPYCWLLNVGSIGGAG